MNTESKSSNLLIQKKFSSALQILSFAALLGWSVPTYAQSSVDEEDPWETQDPCEDECRQKTAVNLDHPGHPSPRFICGAVGVGLLPLGVVTGLLALPTWGSYANGGVYALGTLMSVLDLIGELALPDGLSWPVAILLHAPAVLGTAAMTYYNFVPARSHQPWTRSLVNFGGGTGIVGWYLLSKLISLGAEGAHSDERRVQLYPTPQGVGLTIQF